MNRLFWALLLSACHHEAPAPKVDPLDAIEWDRAPLDWSKPVPTGVIAPEDDGYVGSAACKPCHEEVWAKYQHHSMARTGMRRLETLDQKWLAKIFDGAKSVKHERSGFWYRPFRRGKNYFVEEYLLDGDGERVQSWEQPLTHALSAGTYGMAFWFKQGTRLWQAPIDYYAKLARWDLDPGDVEGNFRFAKPLRTFCISCHTEYPRRRAGSDEVFEEPFASGVGCERCHGPGARHVRSLRTKDIVNPAKLSELRQLEVCTQCHLSSGAQLRAGQHNFGFRPGARLEDFRVNFLGEPVEPDRFSLLAHPERMVRSACWKKSGKKLVCTSCHDPHVSALDEPETFWDGKCLVCHDKQPCKEKHTAGCVSCHMRRGPPRNPSLITVTDHFIQRRPPKVLPGREDKPERLVRWSNWVGEPASGDDLVAMDALGARAFGRIDDATRLAAEGARSRPHVPELYDFLAGLYRARRQPAKAAAAFAAVLRFDLDARDELFDYARAMLDADQIEEAMRALDRMLALDPDDPAALETKAIFLARSGRVEEAAPLFARAAQDGPMAAASHVALSVLAERKGAHAEAIAQLRAAQRIEPGDSWILEKLPELTRARQFFAGHKATGASAWLPRDWR